MPFGSQCAPGCGRGMLPAPNEASWEESGRFENCPYAVAGRFGKHFRARQMSRPHPALDEVVTFGARESVFRIGRRLRTDSFQTALILPNSPRSALEAFLARIPERIGYRKAWRNLFLTRAIPLRPELVTMRKRSSRELERLITSSRKSEAIPAQSHHLYHYLHLAATLGAKPDPTPPHIAVIPDE